MYNTVPVPVYVDEPGLLFFSEPLRKLLCLPPLPLVLRLDRHRAKVGAAVSTLD